MATLRITGVQMEVKPAKKDNLPRILNLIEHADCDIIVFPSMALTGYNSDFSDTRTEEAWEKIAAECRKIYTSAIVGTGARRDGHGYIEALVFGDDGETLGYHDMLVPTEKDRTWARPGDELTVFNDHNVTFGCLIANDVWVAPGMGPYPDPRLTYQLAHTHGAQVIFHLNHSGIDPQYRDYYDSNLRLRAREARCPIVTVNATDPRGRLNVPSGVISAEGEWIHKVEPQGEHTFTLDLDLE
ncbi:MAG: hypothetical protein GC168_12665 [Candidatus Hydrogenedens sp.]|nr:hypothetical protein [Candidatus Hydrogenedens sp.]